MTKQFFMRRRYCNIVFRRYISDNISSDTSTTSSVHTFSDHNKNANKFHSKLHLSGNINRISNNIQTQLKIFKPSRNSQCRNYFKILNKIKCKF